MMNAKSPVVIVHGMWSTPDALDEIKASFESKGYEVHTPRLPFHYPKNKMDTSRRSQLASTSVQDYIATISQLMDQLGQDHPEQAPILVGHSMGGLLAQIIATKYPCEKLVLISSAPPAGINGWSWSVLRTFGHNLFKFPLWRTTTNLRLKNIRYGIANTQNAEVHREITQKSTFESGWASTQISMWFLFRRPPTKVDYAKVQCPVLIISGTHDKITPIKVQHKLAKKYSERASLRVIQGACHWTLGGSYFPQIKQSLFTWLHHESNQSHPGPQSTEQAA
jgi:pimeloyl-ACP methyl ester carboxylesterase